MSTRIVRGLPALLIAAALFARIGFAQAPPSEPSGAAPKLPEIVDEPKTIDAATLMPPKLAARATHDFADTSLREVVAWLQDEAGLVVLLNNAALAEIGVTPSEPVSDRLDDEPVYLVLNRLRSLGLAWYLEDNVLHITSAAKAEDRTTTMPYNVGDLLDAGYDWNTLIELMTTTVSPMSWDEQGGLGAINNLGDVLFVRQTDDLQRDVQGLLAALRMHARQTFVNDPPQHVALREKLNATVSVDFADTPLEAAVAQLERDASVDIRLDLPALRDQKIREREPVTLKLADCKLETVIDAMISELKLTWAMRDGVLWITSPSKAEELMRIAVYDVRDLCKDWDESEALLQALTSQASPTSWDEQGGPGSIASPIVGALVIAQAEHVHREVLSLLETYRSALRSSKPRTREEEDPNKIVVVYYRMHVSMAHDLLSLLPALVASETWRSEARPDAPGTIVLVASAPDVSISAAPNAGELPRASSARSVLIVAQTRAVHSEIEQVLRRIQNGDWPVAVSYGLGGGLGASGGFGGEQQAPSSSNGFGSGYFEGGAVAPAAK